MYYIYIYISILTTWEMPYILYALHEFILLFM